VSDEPIVTSRVEIFSELDYYEPRSIRERLLLPIKPDLDIRYIGYDTGDLLAMAASQHLKMNVASYDSVLAANPHFLLAAVPDDFLPWYLISEGYRVTPVGNVIDPVLFQVDAPHIQAQ
jgi:hypothetical protein